MESAREPKRNKERKTMQKPFTHVRISVEWNRDPDAKTINATYSGIAMVE